MAKLSKRALKARAEFRKAYSRTTFNVVDAIRRGWSNKRISSKYKLSIPSVVTFRGNLTRGAYYPYISRTRDGAHTTGMMY